MIASAAFMESVELGQSLFVYCLLQNKNRLLQVPLRSSNMIFKSGKNIATIIKMQTEFLVSNLIKL